ncbi:MAG: hypothetical protein PHD01_12530, partial [Geobacteraceae bacterium]|nr:hypothetical protein [Geobacteraceae bacterium]
MNHLSNQKGIALITSLMLTLICLSIVMAMYYLIGQGVQTSAGQKAYRTANEASYGGADIVLKNVVPLVFQGLSSASIHNEFTGSLNLQFPSGSTCLHDKLTLKTSKWPTSCSQTLDAKTSPDISFTLNAVSATAVPYKVSTKIVDTISGNTDISGLQLEGAGVAESSSVITPQHFPYVYRLEVQAERSVNAKEQASLSVT